MIQNTYPDRLRAIVDRVRPELRGDLQADIDRLLQAGGDTYDGLLQLAQTADTPTRMTAFWALGLLGYKQTALLLLRIFRDTQEEMEVRKAAAASLRLLRNKRTTRPLIHMMQQDKDPRLREYAAYALGWLHDARAVEPLMAVLSNTAETPCVCGQAAEALANLLEGTGDRQPIPALVEATRDPAAEIRFWATFALGVLGDRREIPLLQHLAQTDMAIAPGWWSVGKEATDAIQWIRERQAEDREARKVGNKKRR